MSRASQTVDSTAATTFLQFNIHKHNSKQNKRILDYASFMISLTDLAMEGRPHSVLSSLVLCKRPCESTLLSRTSTPKTLGFMGLGYFCIAALVTVSHGWLHGNNFNIEMQATIANTERFLQ